MKKIKVAVIGLGNWGESHLETFLSLPGCEVVAVCDWQEGRLHQIADKHGIIDRYTDESALMSRTDIDLISVVTYEKAHHATTMAALRSGKHVLVEKPVTTNLQEAKQMFEMAKSSGNHLIPAHLLRFDPRYMDIYNGIHDGRVGKPLSIFLKRSRGRGLYEIYKRTHTVYELTIHDIDLAIWYAGCRVKSVRAYGQSKGGSDAPEVLWANLMFENGILAVLQGDWMTPDEANIPNCDSAEVIGEHGTAAFRTHDAGLHIWNPNGGRHTTEFNIHAKVNGRIYGMLKEQLSYVVDCLTFGRDLSIVSFEEAVHGIAVAEAIVLSCKTNQDIQL